MFEWPRGLSDSNINDRINGSGGVTPAGNVDMLAEEKGILLLMVDTLNNTLDHKFAKSGRNGDNSDKNNISCESSSQRRGVIATDVEMVELLSMLPRVLQSAVDPAIIKQKEQQRELMAVYNVPRPPPFSRCTILYRLLFTPLSLVSSSHTLSFSSLPSPSAGGSEVLNCIARLLICSCGSMTRASSVLQRQSNPQPIVTDEGETPMGGDSITIASLHSLGGILHLCLNDSDENEHEGGGVCMTPMLLRDVLRHVFSKSGLYEHLWCSLLFHPIPDAIREAMGRILSDLSHSNVLRFPTVMAVNWQSISPAVWGERVTQCILSDPSSTVKESLITVLHEGLMESISADNKSGSFIHWKRWMTNTSLGYLLSVLATGAPISVLQSLLATLTLTLELELQEGAGQLQRSVRPGVLEQVHLLTVVEVCTTRLVYLFTGPNAVNRQIWTGEDDVELISYRLLVGGLVQLLRLALKGVDVLLSSLSNSHRSGSGRNNVVEKAILVLRTCVEKQLVTALLTCLEEQYQQQQQQVSRAMCMHTFLTGRMRAEMVRLLRDLLERAAPPLFAIMGRFIPYLPMMLQSILSGAGRKEFPPPFGSKQQQQEEQECDPVCSEVVEMVTLLGVVLCHSSQMREGFLETLSTLQCTWEQCNALFDVLEATARSLPEHTVKNLIIIDVTGTVINETEGPLQSNAVERIMRHQGERKQRDETRGINGRIVDQTSLESRWVAIQQQRLKRISQRSHTTCGLVYLVLHHLRGSIMKEMSGGITHRDDGSDTKEEVDGVSLSPIQPRSSASTGSTRIVISGNTDGDGVTVVDDLKRNTSCRRHEERAENEVYDDATDNKYESHSIVNTHSSLSTGQRADEGEEQTRRKSTLVLLPSSGDPSIGMLLRRVRQCQMESAAAEEKMYHSALDLFTALASRYCRQVLTPQASVGYLKRQEYQGRRQHSHSTPPTTQLGNSIRTVNTGRSNCNTTLRLWTGKDVRREDLFYFSLPIREIKEESIIALMDRCKKHQQTLRRTLRITQQTPRGRRWFLEDATTNIMGRLIALFQIFILAIQLEGEKVVQGALAGMPRGCDKAMVLDSVDVHSKCADDVMGQELHCGTIVDMANFIALCFSLPMEIKV